MSQEQEMRFEEPQRDEPKPGLEEIQRDEPKSAFKDEIFGYRSYANEIAGQKIQEVSEQKAPTHSQRLFLAVISLGMLMFVSLTAMFLFARMGTTPTFFGGGPGHFVVIDARDGMMMGQMGEHGWRMARNYAVMGNSNELISWMLLVPVFLFFVATLAVNKLFSRGSK